MQTSYRTEVDVLEEQVLFRRCRIGRDAAREIARRVEGGHGFWDFESRKATSMKSTEGVDAEVHDGAPHHFLAGESISGEETPQMAA